MLILPANLFTPELHKGLGRDEGNKILLFESMTGNAVRDSNSLL